MKKNLDELYEELSKLGLPVTYNEWEVGKVPDLPYIVVYESGKNPFYADNRTHYLTNMVTVELYTDFKDIKTESLLEAFFYAQNITLSSVDETFWTDEHLHEVSYEFEI